MRPRPVLAALAVCAAALLAAPLVFPSTDGLYSLAWGSWIAGGHRAGIDTALVPVAHPLPILAAALLSPLGTDDARFGFQALAVLSFAALGYAAFRLGRALGGLPAGILAALLVLTRAAPVKFASGAIIDVPFAALVLLAASIVVERPEQNRRLVVLVLLAVAGLARPEAWVLSALYALWLLTAGRLPGRERVVTLALAIAAPVAWTLFDLALSGDPLQIVHAASSGSGGRPSDVGYPSFHGHGVAALDRLGHVLRAGLPDAVGLPLVAIGAAFGLWSLVRVIRRRSDTAARPAAIVTAMTLAGIASVSFLALAGLKLAPRFLLVPALALTVLAAGALGQAKRRSAAVAICLLVAVAAIPGTFHRFAETADLQDARKHVINEATRLVSSPAVRGALKHCPAIAIGGFPRDLVVATRPVVADVLGRDPSSLRLHRTPKTGHRTSVLIFLHRYYAEGRWSFYSPCLGRAHRARGRGAVLGTGLGGGR